VKRFIPFDPDQPLLLPPDLRDALPSSHPAVLVGELVEQLDLRGVYADLADERVGGAPGFDPRMMVRVWLYAYLTGVRSSRRVAQALVENVAFRVLSNNQSPQYWALNRFRTRHRVALGNLLVQTVSLAAGMGLVRLALVAIDGTKIKANASKHKALSYGRMDEREERLRREVEGFLRDCDEHDERDERSLGPDDDGLSLPPGLRSVQARRNKIAAAKRELEERARSRRAREQAKRKADAEREGKSYEPRQEVEDATPKANDQINLVDGESRIMVSGGAFVQAYNGQAAVDAASHIVVAATLSNLSVDAPHLPELVEQTMANTGGTPDVIAGDAGYSSDDNVQRIEELGAEALIPPDKVRHSEWRAQRSPKGRIPNDISSRDRMRRKLATKRGKRLYLKRQASVEPVFGTLKCARGLQQFLHRGLEKNHHLFRFDMAVHNITKLIRQLQQALQASNTTINGHTPTRAGARAAAATA
jgi:transposase